jgi:hypothetical protein
LTRRRTVTSLALATAIALAGVLYGVLAGGVKAAAPAEAPASPTARAQLAAQTAQAAATLATLPRGSVRLTRLPEHEEKLLGANAVRTPAESLDREERAKLVEITTLWVTRVAPRQLFAYFGARLPPGTSEGGSSSGDISFSPPRGHETLQQIKKREAVNYWSKEYRLPLESSALRLRMVSVYVARATGGRFVVRVDAAAVWEQARPVYSLLGTNVHAVTIATPYQPPEANEPPPVVITTPALVSALVETVNDIPIGEGSGDAPRSCPSESIGAKHRTLLLTFAEQTQGPTIATFQETPSACPVIPRITLPGHPPLELSEDPQLIATIEKTSGISLKHH